MNICSRIKKQTTILGQNIGGIRVNWNLGLESLAKLVNYIYAYQVVLCYDIRAW